MIYERGFDSIPFENRAKERVKQIYSIIYYLNNGLSYREAIKETLKNFPEVHTESTIESKATTQLGLTKNEFWELYKNGKLLEYLISKNNLSENDAKIFAELLGTPIEKSAEKVSNGIALPYTEKILKLWKGSLEKQPEGVHFKTSSRYAEIKKMKEEVRDFVYNPTEENFRKFWNEEYIYAAQRAACAENVWKSNDSEILVRTLSEMLDSEEFREEWVENVKNARKVLWELFGLLHIEKVPPINSCTKNGLDFFGYPVKEDYEYLLSKFNAFKEEVYMEKVGHITAGKDYEIPINLEIDQFFNVIDKVKGPNLKDDLKEAHTEEERLLYETVLRAKKEVKSSSEKEKDEGKHYFWLNADPSRWTVDEIRNGDVVTYTSHTENGNKRRIPSAFQKAKKGDEVIFYETSPRRKVVALGVVEKGLHEEYEEEYGGDTEVISIRFIRDLGPIEREELKTIPELKDFAPLKGHMQGSLFEMAEKQFYAILNFAGTPEKTKSPSGLKWKDLKPILNHLNSDRMKIEGTLYFPNNIKEELESRINSAISSGKHIILIGPPGTGKSKLAKMMCEQYKGKEKYIMSTANSDWSTFDTIGGYFPSREKEGKLEFKPRIFLNCFRDEGGNADNKWLIIDEINRADIDKAFGALFSALTGDNITLPFEMNGKQVRIMGNPEDDTPVEESAFIIPEKWRIIATMNTFDKSSLYEMSYAFMRRFAFIPVGVPDDIGLDDIEKYLEAWNKCKDEGIDEEKLLKIWKSVNKIRKIGPAIVKDICEFVSKSREDYASAIIMYVLPQFEGLADEKIISFIKDIKEIIGEAEADKIEEFSYDFFSIERTNGKES